MKYQKIKILKITHSDNKFWVIAEFENGTIWMPSFSDIGSVLNLIGQCEDLKYPNGKGKKMVIEFMEESINIPYKDLGLLLEKYKISNKRIPEKKIEGK